MAAKKKSSKKSSKKPAKKVEKKGAKKTKKQVRIAAAKKAAATRKRNAAKRSAAAKKAAATRKRNAKKGMARGPQSRPTATKSAAKARLLKAWRRQYQGVARTYEAAEATENAFKAGLTNKEVSEIMDRASGYTSFDLSRMGEKGYPKRKKGWR